MYTCHGTVLAECCALHVNACQHPTPGWLQVRPSLKKVTQTVKFQLSGSMKKERVAVARELLTWPYSKRMDMVFVDGSTVFVVPEGGKVWVDTLKEADTEQLVVDERLGGSAGFKLVYYAAVNARLGVVLLWLCTGTTGLMRGFRVSSPAASCTMLPGMLSVRCSP